ncbi:thioredoxin family protein [Syntrophorhabdus aromaticivorans]|nr:thioredoxin family protein [Syntrophorhabdus aromaticivorans]
MMKCMGRTFSTGMFFIAALLLSLMLFVVPGETPAQTEKVAKGNLGLPRIVDVGADKCIPCIMMAPILEELKKEYAGVLVVEFVDVWKNPQTGQQYGVRGIPTQIFYDANGKELKRHIGFISKQEILNQFQRLGISLKPAKKKGI